MEVATAFQAIMDGHQQHERLRALAEIAHTLADEDFWFMFSVVYRDAKVLYPHHEAIRAMLTPDRLNAPERVGHHSDEEQQVWRERLRRAKENRRPLKVYRGGGQHNLTGFAWTTRRKDAERWALLTGAAVPLIVVAYVDPRQIIMTLLPGSGLMVLPETVQVGRVDNIVQTASVDAGNPVSRRVAAHGLPPEMQAEAIRRMAETHTNFSIQAVVARMEKDGAKLAELGFKARPAYLDAVLRELRGETSEEKEAA